MGINDIRSRCSRISRTSYPPTRRSRRGEIADQNGQVPTGMGSNSPPLYSVASLIGESVIASSAPRSIGSSASTESAGTRASPSVGASALGNRWIRVDVLSLSRCGGQQSDKEQGGQSEGGDSVS